MRSLIGTLMFVALSANAQPSSPQRLDVRSTGFGMNDPIPVVYTCDGANISPRLTWSEVPEGTKSIAILVDDPDAPTGTFTHWLVTGLPADTPELPSGAVVPNATQAMNDSGEPRYTGPCPPSGRHRYRFTVFALDMTPRGQMSRETFLDAIKGHVLGQGTLIGLYQREK